MTINLSEDISGWPPERTVFPVAAIDLRVLPGEHPLHLAHRAAAEANWDQEIAANPMLFDGRMVLQHRLSVSPEGIAGEAYIVPFSTFMWWRRQPVKTGGFHLFAYPVIASADGALVAIKMADHTANPGSVYFAAGSLDENDVVDGRCDLGANMLREVKEETGLDLGEALMDGGYYAIHQDRWVTLFRVFRFAKTADELVADIERHMTDAEDKEIADAVVIRSADPTAQPYHGSMVTILDWFFSGQA